MLGLPIYSINGNNVVVVNERQVRNNEFLMLMFLDEVPTMRPILKSIFEERVEYTGQNLYLDNFECLYNLACEELETSKLGRAALFRNLLQETKTFYKRKIKISCAIFFLHYQYKGRCNSLSKTVLDT